MGLFDYDGKLMDALRKFSDLVFFNILFCAFSLPVITAGAGLCALCEGARMVAAEEEIEEGNFRAFWNCFKRNFRRATLLWLLVLGIAGMMAAMFFSLPMMPAQVRSVYTVTVYVFGFLFLIWYQYLFPIAAAHASYSLGQIIRASGLYALAALPQTLVCILITGVFVYVTVILNMNIFRFVIFLWCACGFGIVTYLNSFFFLRIEKKLGAQQTAN